MPQELSSIGICSFCNASIDRSNINQHLIAHLKEKAAANKTQQKATSFLLDIEPDPEWGSSPYFLSLWVGGSVPLEDIDFYLRDIWLDCCGHLSAFTDPSKRPNPGQALIDEAEVMALFQQGKEKEAEAILEAGNGAIPMRKDTKTVFKKGRVLQYNYDFGSTTTLQITVVDEFPIATPRTGLKLLSRNEPLEIYCSECKTEIATHVCIVCSDEEESFLCPACSKKHGKTCKDYLDYGKVKIVNSPRLGICAYSGGAIDKKRDGVFKKPIQA